MKKIIVSFFFAALIFPHPSVHADESPVSFARFAYFIDSLEFPTKKIGRVWATPLSVYEGPFFTNDSLHIYLPPNYFQEAHSPFFRGPVSAVGPVIDYYGDYGPKGSSQEEMIFQSDVKTGVPQIPLPSNPNEALKEAAYGGLNPKDVRPSNLILPHDESNHLTGGIVFAGTLGRLTFDGSPNSNFKITFGKLRKETVVEVDLQRDQTSVSVDGEKPAVYAGTPNGAIYVDGDIGLARDAGLSGKVKGRWTVGARGDIFVPDSLLYSDTPRGSQPQGNDCLALIARNVFITRNAPDLLFLYATVFAAKHEGKEKLGTLFVLPNPDSPHRGDLIWWGNYIGEYPAIMGTFDRATGESKDGYELHKFYDARLASAPPPYFPMIPLQKLTLRQ